MRNGIGFRDIFLLFTILALFTSIFIILVSLPLKPHASDEYATYDEFNTTKEIIAQNKYFREEITRMRNEQELLLYNISSLTAIINEQDKLIRRMHDRLGNYQDTGIEVISPTDRITNDEIIIKDTSVIIKLPYAKKGAINDTHSELPLLNENSTTLEITPKTEQDVHIGDIIVYHSLLFNALIIHRVISQGYDKDGWFVITKGDNNLIPDNELVRFRQIRSIVVGIIY